VVKKFDIKLINYINLFNSITKVMPKDCFFEDEKLVFIVKEGDLGRVIGKHGSTIKRLGGIIKKDIKLIEYSEDLIQFVKNLISPIEVQKLYKEGSTIFIEELDNKIKGRIYGRDRKNLSYINDILKKYFNCELKIK